MQRNVRKQTEKCSATKGMTMKHRLTNPIQTSSRLSMLSARCALLPVVSSFLIAGALAGHSSHANAQVTDAAAIALAQQILDDYKQERRLNVPRWADLAHDDDSGKSANCPVAKFNTKSPVSFKDCNLEYFKLREERWADVMQSWAVLDGGQKADLSRKMAPMFESLSQSTGISVSGQAVAKGYGSSTGGGGAGANPTAWLGALLGALGIDAGTESLITAITSTSGFASSTPDLFKNLLAAHSRQDIQEFGQTITDTAARFREFKPETAAGVISNLKTAKFSVDTQKNSLAETSNVALNSKTRADAVKDITAKIQALGSSTADQSLVSAQLAQYEFYLAALDALGREELIKAAAQRRGDRAQKQLLDIGFDVKQFNDAARRVRN
jgi:hypothetical protein